METKIAPSSQFVAPSSRELEAIPNLTDEYIKGIINQYQTENPFPFLAHLDYFKTNGEITTCSIGDRWSELSGESRLKTYVKGKITTNGANYANESYQEGTCPWKKSFQSDEMMGFLKHPCDTGIVNRDGSINEGVLKFVIKSNFVWSAHYRTFILRKSVMKNHVEECIERDYDKPEKNHWSMPSYATVARNEWHDFFLNFSDDEIEGDPMVNIDTFICFYFNPKTLYGRVLQDNVI